MLKNDYGPMACCEPAVLGRLPEDITLEQLKKAYLELERSHAELRDRLWRAEDQINAYRIVLKGTL